MSQQPQEPGTDLFPTQTDHTHQTDQTNHTDQTDQTVFVQKDIGEIQDIEELRRIAAQTQKSYDHLRSLSDRRENRVNEANKLLNQVMGLTINKEGEYEVADQAVYDRYMQGIAPGAPAAQTTGAAPAAQTVPPMEYEPQPFDYITDEDALSRRIRAEARGVVGETEQALEALYQNNAQQKVGYYMQQLNQHTPEEQVFLRNAVLQMVGAATPKDIATTRVLDDAYLKAEGILAMQRRQPHASVAPAPPGPAGAPAARPGQQVAQVTTPSQGVGGPQKQAFRLEFAHPREAMAFEEMAKAWGISPENLQDKVGQLREEKRRKLLGPA